MLALVRQCTRAITFSTRTRTTGLGLNAVSPGINFRLELVVRASVVFSLDVLLFFVVPTFQTTAEHVLVRFGCGALGLLFE